MTKKLTAACLLVFFSMPAFGQSQPSPLTPGKTTVVGKPEKVESPAKKLEPTEEHQPKPVIEPEVQPEPGVGPVIEKKIEKVKGAMAESRGWREVKNYQILATYSPFDLIIPSKLGLSASYIAGADRTYELEYMRGSVSVPFLIKDLGAMTDERLTLLKRSYLGSNSFNLSYGLSYMRFHLHLGDEILSRLTGGGYPSVDLLGIESLGFDIGLGNRWIFNERFVLGVDWITWSQPLLITKRDDAFLDYATDANDRDNVDDAVKLIAYFPRFAFLKLQFGMTF